MANTIAMILAGGQGSRLSILSEHRAKPAVPFGSNYRIIDFVLSNAMHSDIQYVGIMTQYKPHSLMTHIGTGEAWGFSGRRSAAKILPPYTAASAGDWYAGTADAIYQNLSFVNRFDVDTVVVLSGDHIYSMNYHDMIASHWRNKADLTIATQTVPWEQADRFGVLKCDKQNRIEAFEEKPKGKPISNRANLGIYIFKRAFLEEYLMDDAQNPDSSHDFGKDIIPNMIRENRCFAFEFPHYWRDVGTLGSYWEANMECLDPRGGLDLKAWRVQTNCLDIPNQFNMPTHVNNHGTVVNSMIGKGSVIRGSVINSILFRGVEVGEGAEVRDSILMDGAQIGPGVRARHLIADKYVEIGAETVIGILSDDDPATKNLDLDSRLTLLGMYARVPESYSIGHKCIVYPDLGPEDFDRSGMPSGAVLRNDKQWAVKRRL